MAGLLVVLSGAGCVDLGRPTVLSEDWSNDGSIGGDPDVNPEPEEMVAKGRPCTRNAQCATGTCSHGVCCATACDGTCEACNLAGLEGTCAKVPAGEDPGDSCPSDPSASCGRDGTCDGKGACRLHPATSECAPGTCVGSTEYAARTCDGKGTCQPGTTRPCAAGACSAGACPTGCTSNADCQAGFFCEGTCKVKKVIGSSCANAAQCATNYCADGICCGTPCTERCYACNIPSALGMCVPVPDGQDVHQECAAQTATTCGRAGGCNGSGSCRLHPAGTSCGPQTCTAGIEKAPDTCDGIGNCVAGPTRSCGQVACSGNACGTACTASSQCASGYVCTAGSCRKSTPDAGIDTMPTPNGQLLVVDDFADSVAASNLLGGLVDWTHQHITLIDGQMKMLWDGVSDFSDLTEAFRSDQCGIDISAYTKVRFKMRASEAGQKMDVFLSLQPGASCANETIAPLGTVTLTTTLTTYELSIAGVARTKARQIEFDPTEINYTVFYIDDLTLVP